MTDTRPAASIDRTVFAEHYLAHAASRLPGRSPSALDELALDHLDFGMVRHDGEVLVRAVASPGGTAFQIVSADALFLVDSVRAALSRGGHPVDRFLHPQLVVERGPDGRLVTIFDIDDAAEVPDGAMTESWMRAEVDDLAPAAAGPLVDGLRQALRDVHLFNQDADQMYATIRRLAGRLAEQPGYFDADTSREAGELLTWLADGNFIALGHAAYTATDLMNPAAKGNDILGVLRGDARLSAAELLPAFRSGAPLVVFKSPLTSRVRRSARYDCVTVSTGGPGEGQVLHVFLGLLTAAEDGTVGRVPVVRRRIAEILLRAGVRRDSHTGRQLIAALRTLPRDELLEAPTGDLLRLSQMIVERANSNRVGVFARTHLNRDFVSVLVYFAADKFGPDVRRRVSETISRYWPGEIVAREDRLTDLGFARMQFLIALRPGVPQRVVERAEVEAEVARLVRRWRDDATDQLAKELGTEQAEQLLRQYAIPEAFKEDFDADIGATDLLRLERLDESDGLAFDIYTPYGDDPADRRLKVFRRGKSVSLARVLPIFTQMGIEVLDERPYEFERRDGHSGWIYDFGLKLPSVDRFDSDAATRLLDALRLLWRGEIEQDGFNALVVRAGLTWWQANVLRAYAKYLRQTGTTFSQGYIEQALTENPQIVRDLAELFECRFDPAADSAARTADLVEGIKSQLADVASLDQDRILRSLLALVNATLRTNAYRVDDSGERRRALAFKMDPTQVPGLPSPKPRFEIWVYSPRVEGVHLRMGPVARGGLRWSDRREDFRTEILGLVKAQTVKNAVIVPTGAKGGFVCKQLPDPATDRDAWLAEGVGCYKTFIRSLLDVTDNYGSDGRVVHPPQTRCYDGDDPYLVVAADKGTATFSDIANEISAEYGFWLGDAFASGGSVGYDHKAMGITARGAWESVKYHFRELGVDVQSEDFTVVGVGDMSGDVFGNGMLLSEHIRLVAAFDHRHIFLDPNPDAATSYQERRRLFDLPRSSWADYDRSLISPGGGVYPRTAKSVPISEQVAERLGLPDGTTALTPTELMHAILVAPVDLLWNGGIGTYVKASTEPQTAAGDKANDALRADATELRCKVVGEGGNLGFTQLGRIEYVIGGGKMNTDAIDNSAGVDTSDHEVNLKILLDRAVAAGRIDRDERNRLLAEVTEDVARLVLRDNYEQNVLLSMARRLSPSLVSVHQRFIHELEDAGELDRSIEFLPSDAELQRRDQQGFGLVSPENAVLTAYAKLTLTHQLVQSTLPDEPSFQVALRSYFPKRITERLAEDLDTHPLRREIITTVLVNDMINRSGTTFVHRAREETGVDAANVARAYTVIREVFGLAGLWAAIESLDNQVPVTAQHAAYQEIRRLIDRGSRWMVEKHFPLEDVGVIIARYQPTVTALAETVPDLLRGVERDNLQREIDRLVGLGLPRELSIRVSRLLNAYLLLDVVDIAGATGRPAAAVAELHFALSEQCYVDELLTKVTALPRDDRWSTLARAAVRHDVYAALAALTAAVLRQTPDSLGVDERIAAWEAANEERVVRARDTIREAVSVESANLATLSVALRVMRALPN